MIEVVPLPDTGVEWLRLTNALAGVAAFGLLLFRLVGRWDHTSWLSRTIVALLALAVLTLGLGAARAEQIDAAFNELGYLALVVNLGAIVAGLAWHRWLDPSRRRT